MLARDGEAPERARRVVPLRDTRALRGRQAGVVLVEERRRVRLEQLRGGGRRRAVRAGRGRARPQRRDGVLPQCHAGDAQQQERACLGVRERFERGRVALRAPHVEQVDEERGGLRDLGQEHVRVRLQLPHEAVLAEQPREQRAEHGRCAVGAACEAHEGGRARAVQRRLDAEQGAEQEREARRRAEARREAARPRLDARAQQLELRLVLAGVRDGEGALRVRAHLPVLGIEGRALALHERRIGAARERGALVEHAQPLGEVVAGERNLCDERVELRKGRGDVRAREGHRAVHGQGLGRRVRRAG